MRILVGPTDEAAFDNPTRDYVYPTVEPQDYAAVLDFGCGCGRLARQLMQQRVPPGRYLGVDLHLGMIRWCQEHLTPRAPQFVFEHHDVLNLSFNPGDKPLTLPFPAADRSFTLVNAHSVFTHLTQPQTEHYLGEIRRILRDDGVFRSTWFFFDRADFPMLQDRQAAIYTTQPDVTGAVVYDREWVVERTRALGLTVTHVTPPYIRGFQWEILMRPDAVGIEPVEFPEDRAPRGSQPPPIPESDPKSVGL
jgi:SAM-dependent methyltransferase